MGKSDHTVALKEINTLIYFLAAYCMQGMLILFKKIKNSTGLRPLQETSAFLPSFFIVAFTLYLWRSLCFHRSDQQPCICARIHLSSVVFTKTGFDPCVEGSLLYN